MEFFHPRRYIPMSPDSSKYPSPEGPALVHPREGSVWLHLPAVFRSQVFRRRRTAGQTYGRSNRKRNFWGSIH